MPLGWLRKLRSKLRAPDGTRNDRPSAITLDQVVALLADPETHEPLAWKDDVLVASKSGRAFPIVEDVPCLLAKEAKPSAPVAPRHAAVPDGMLVLDVGTKTGKGILSFRAAHWRRLGLDRDARWHVVGIDMNQRRLVEARKNAIFAIQADGARMPFRDASFDVTVITELLEHVPRELAVSVLTEARRVTRGIIFVENPDFSSEAYLSDRGLKFAWMDWRVHPHHITLDGMRSIVEEAGFARFDVEQVYPVTSSDHAEIVPLSAPRDTQRFDAALHERPHVSFDAPIFEKLRVELDVRKHV